jgi:hypothetical protein
LLPNLGQFKWFLRLIPLLRFELIQQQQRESGLRSFASKRKYYLLGMNILVLE